MGRDALITVGSIQEYCRRKIKTQLELAEPPCSNASRAKLRARASELSELLGWINKKA